MAEQRTRRSQSQTRRSNSRGQLSAPEAVARVRRELPPLLGHPVEAVLGVEPGDSKGWSVTVSVVEMARIPPTTDVLGAYDVTLDQNGELQSYKRTRRYYRNQADED
ncbi:MAG: gas vesicle protein [Solirubrobacterales bacterium]|nr:gas vesicle protein [Solirubrobacterales bacterium]